MEETKAIAHLPGLDIEIEHRRLPEGQGEQISIHLTAVPSFEAFAKTFELFNPFALWAEAMRAAWAPWFEGTRAMMMRPPSSLPRPTADRR